LVRSKVLLNLDRFEIGQSYVTAKILNRYSEKVTINIQGGQAGIELQETLFKIKDEPNGRPIQYAYLITRLLENNKIFVRKLPVVGIRDWLLIYEDTLVELSVKDAYDELEILVV
jgi:transcriptional regulator